MLKLDCKKLSAQSRLAAGFFNTHFGVGLPKLSQRLKAMSLSENDFPKFVWLSGRETWSRSPVFGELVVPEIVIWEFSGSLPHCGRVMAKIPHGSRVRVLEKEYVEEDKEFCYRILTNQVEGWVSEMFISWKWSCFTFLGSLKPSRVCENLDLNLSYEGLDLIIKKNQFAVVVEGDPSHFDSIRIVVEKYIKRITNSQSPLTNVSLQFEFSNWVEVPIGYQEISRTVGFLSSEGDQMPGVLNEQIETAHSIVPLLSKVPYLDLALNDYTQALIYPQHALIFLARAIESVENHFAVMTSSGKKTGKEKIMREVLGLKRGDVEYVTKRANESHRRHASRDATVKDLSSEELIECFGKTANILSKFVGHLELIGI